MRIKAFWKTKLIGLFLIISTAILLAAMLSTTKVFAAFAAAEIESKVANNTYCGHGDVTLDNLLYLC